MQTALCKLLWLCIFTLQLNAYTFTATVDNTHPMLGEQTILTLTFRYINIEDYEIEEPAFEDFKTTLLEDTETQENNSTWVATLRYALTPLKAGSLTLPALHTSLEQIPLAYQKEYNRNKYLKKISLTSKPIHMQIIPLPKGIKVTGEYQIHTSVDTQKVAKGKPTIFTLTLAGHGNIDNLAFINLHIPHTTIYELNTTKDTKTFSIVSDSNYTIPPIVLEYFNQSSREVEQIRSDAIAIEVKGDIDRSTPPLVSKKLLLSLLIIGLILLSGYLYKFFDNLAYLDEKTYFIRQLRKAKSKEELLKKIVPYMDNNRQITRLVYKLEVCEVGEFKKLKQEIITSFYH